MFAKNKMAKKAKEVREITTEKEFIKVNAFGVTLYYNIDFIKKEVCLTSPTSDMGYFQALMKYQPIEKHQQFLNCYKHGLDYCHKILKANWKK